MPLEPEDAGGPVEREAVISPSGWLRRPLVLVLVSLGLVTGGAAITATAAGAASSSSETATTQGTSSDASTTQQQENEGEEGQRDCPEKQEAEESA